MARYGFIAGVFTVSGIFHLLCDISQGIPKAESGAMRFFGIQTLGIMFEDAVQAVFKKLHGEESFTWRLATAVTGYLWVVAWLTWTSPIWIYPTISRDTGVPIVPF